MRVAGLHVSQISAEAQAILYQVVHGRQVSVGPELRGEVAERQPDPAQVRCEQVVAGEIGSLGLALARVQYPGAQLGQEGFCRVPLPLPPEYLVVDRGKVPADIEPDPVAEAPRPACGAA